VWISYATFEANDAQDSDRARDVFRRAYDHLKDIKATDERVLIVQVTCRSTSNDVNVPAALLLLLYRLPCIIRACMHCCVCKYPLSFA
jgi:hypothetical protein